MFTAAFINDHHTEYDPDGRRFVLYRVRSRREDGSEVQVYRRYSHFYSLHAQLPREIQAQLSTFPKKRWFGRLSPEFVERRRGDLAEYLLTVMECQAARELGLVQRFLSADSTEYELLHQLSIDDMRNFLVATSYTDTHLAELQDSLWLARRDGLLSRADVNRVLSNAMKRRMDHAFACSFFAILEVGCVGHIHIRDLACGLAALTPWPGRKKVEVALAAFAATGPSQAAGSESRRDNMTIARDDLARIAAVFDAVLGILVAVTPREMTAHFVRIAGPDDPVPLDHMLNGLSTIPADVLASLSPWSVS